MSYDYDTVVLRGVNLQTDRIGTDTLAGLGDPQPVFESGQLVRGDGVWSTRAALGAKTFTLSGWVHGRNQTERDQLWQLVQWAASIEQVPLTIPMKGFLYT